VGACATLAQRVFIAFGGPQGHEDSVEDAVKKATLRLTGAGLAQARQGKLALADRVQGVSQNP
jgi:hypothetical protein